MRGYYLGSVVGAVLAFCVVYLQATGRIGWQWLIATSPMVILGGLCGFAITRIWRGLNLGQ